jgi:SAM-dependent methyltransferase
LRRSGERGAEVHPVSCRAPSTGILRSIRNLLAEPRLAGVDVDSDDRVELHRRILGEKKMIRQVFEEIYRLCTDLDERYFTGAGRRVELGAGASLMKEFIADIVVTDIKPARHLDLVLDALDMPFPDGSVRAFYGLECFHHLSRPEDFFRELSRTLAPGGGCILIEPYHGPVARRLYTRLFDSEGFDPEQKEWSAPEKEMGPMRGANQALSYVVFTRDRRIFDARYPDMKLVVERPLNNYLRYLASGGLNFRPLLPAALAPLLKLGELALAPVNRIFALHHVIVLRKETHP